MIKTAILKIESINKERIFWVFSFSLILFSGLYLYFVTQTILNTASYKITEQSMAMLDSKIGELESKYLSLKKEVDLDLTKKLGYVDASNIKFIDRKGSIQNSSLVSLSK